MTEMMAKRLIRARIEQKGADVDRVARALYEAADTGGTNWDEYVQVNSSYLEVWREMARAAIKVMA